jgi:hypothetical protein
MLNEDLMLFFNNNVAPLMRNHVVDYKFFEKGDLGSLNQIIFNNELNGGAIDLWSSGWVGIHFVDYVQDLELIDVLINPADKKTLRVSFDKLIKLLS